MIVSPGPYDPAEPTPVVAEKTAQIQRGRPFEPGRSGNPLGRPMGSRNKPTLAVEALLDGEAAAITRKAIERALEGDLAALRLCLERILPPRRDRPVAFEFPKIETAADAVAASSAVLAACAAGASLIIAAASAAVLVLSPMAFAQPAKWGHAR